MAHAQKPDLVSQRNGRVHLNRRRESVQSTAGSRGVRISGQTMDRPCSEAQCKSSGYTLQSPISPSLPLPRVTVCHHVSNGLYTSLLSFVRFWRNSTPPSPSWARASSFRIFLIHTQRRTPGVISSSQRPLPDNTQHSQQTDINALGVVRNHNLSGRAAADLRLRPRGHWDRH